MWLLRSNVVFKDEPITSYYGGLMLVLHATSFRVQFMCHIQWVYSTLTWVMVRKQSEELSQCMPQLSV